MSTLADPIARSACHDRLRRLQPDATHLWGKMTAPQMVCHLRDSFMIGSGERHASPASGLLQKTVVKWIALRSPLRWPRGVPTRPEVEQGVGGTPPASWESDCAQLLEAIDAFAERKTFSAHPIFGKMSQRDWLTWGYRHVDHHFRQFGV